MKNPGLKKVFIVSAVVLLVIVIAGVLGYMYLRSTYPVSARDGQGKLKELSIGEKLQDFNYMYDLLKDNHPYFEVEKRKTGYDWLNHKKDFEKWVKSTRNNKEFYNTMNRIVTLIQSGHTGIIPPYSCKELGDLFKSDSDNAWSDVLNNKTVAEKNKGWSNIVDKDLSVLPLMFSYIEGNYIVYGNIDSSRDYMGQYEIPPYSVLESIGNTDIDEYIKNMTDNRILTYDYKRKKLKLGKLAIYCNEGKSMNLTFQTPDGNTVEKRIIGIRYSPLIGSMKSSGSVYSTACEINGERIAYLKISSCNVLNVDSDREGIYKFLMSIKEYPYLIIDIRGNGGGSENYWRKNVVQPLITEAKEYTCYMAFKGGKYIEPFLKCRPMSLKPMSTFPEGLNTPKELKNSFKSFVKYTNNIGPLNSVGFKGKIYLLVDDYVYSSAEAFAVFAKATGWATIVGTWTGGDGIGVDPAVFSLPNSGLVIRFPLEMGLNPDGTSNEEYHTSPDVYAEQTYEDFMKYIQYQKTNNSIINPYDTILNKALELTKK